MALYFNNIMLDRFGGGLENGGAKDRIAIAFDEGVMFWEYLTTNDCYV